MLTQTAAASAAQGLPRPAGARSHARPRRRSIKQLLGGFGDARQRLAVRTGLSVDGQDRSAAPPGLCRRRRSCSRRQATRAASTVTLTTQKYLEIPQLAQILAARRRRSGSTSSSTSHVGRVLRRHLLGRRDRTGTTPWLNTPMDITDWGHRSVPNVVLNSSVKTGGVWNEADYSNKEVDQAIANYVAALSLKDQRSTRGSIETQMLHDSPVHLPVLLQLDSGGFEEGQGLQGRRRSARSTSARPRSPRRERAGAGPHRRRPARPAPAPPDGPVSAQALRTRTASRSSC